MSDDPDLRAILARRRLLISAAAAAMGCSIPQDRLHEKIGPRTPLPDWEVFNARIPPFSVDSRIPAEDKAPLESFGTLVEAVYKKMHAAQKALTDAWNHPSEKPLVNELTRVLTGFREDSRAIVPLCGDGLGTRTWVTLRRAVHVRFLNEQLRLLEAHYQTVSGGDQLGMSAQPCLSCAGEEPFPRDFIPYAPGELEYPPSADKMLDELLEQEPSTIIFVNGHTGTEEPNGADLSKERAENVRKRLTERGLDGSRIRVRPMADAVPIEPDGMPGNRRVDFERRISLDL
ncbi:MAG: OmpA family protein [Polyangiaceae bacterium]|nr:OmpA family protein [Polyangiaceae bacterium]